MNKSYKFSIVIAIYNMENYIAQTIDSIVNQTIGFEDNLQVLLVNDGSIDNSEAICKSYVTKFPENMIYIAKENGGVSDARNKGLKYATGELVNFLDADDKLELDALEKVYTFFQQNKAEVDLISIPLYFFDGKDGEHILNHKFKSSRVIDIFKEPMCFQMHISSSFIKLQEIKKYAFNTKLKIGEDAEVANKVILNKGKFGVVADTKYWYRKRSTGGSAIQDAKSNKANYIPPLKYLHLELIDFAKKKYNYVPEYLQWLFSYDLGWKIRTPYIEATVLEKAELEEFFGYVKQVVSFIDDEIILGSSVLRSSHWRKYYNWYLFKLKYTDITKEQLTIKSNNQDAVLCLNNHIIDLLYKQIVYVENIEIEDDRLSFSGSFNCLFDIYDFKIIVESNGVETEIPHSVNESVRVTSLNQFVTEGYCFKVDMQLDKPETSLKAKIQLGDTKSQIKFMFKQDDLEVSNNTPHKEMGDYKVLIKNKLLVVKNVVSQECNDDQSNKKEQCIKKEINPFDTDMDKLSKLFSKNKLVPYGLPKIIGNQYKKSSKNIVEKIADNVLLNSANKKFPINYRYYFLSKLKYNGDYDLNVATTFDQACLYNKDNILLTKGTDITVSVEKCHVSSQMLTMKATIASPLTLNMYQLKCYCDKQSFDCDLAINNKKSPKWFGESIVECCEFEVVVPIKEKSEVYFVLNIGLSNSVTKLQINNSNLVKTADKAGIKMSLKEMQKITLSYCKN